MQEGNALWLDEQIRIMSPGTAFGTYKLGDGEKKLMKTLFCVLDALEPVRKDPLDDDKKYIFWFSMPAPSAKEYSEAYHEEYITDEEMEEEWRAYYPYDTCWYKVTAVTHQDRGRERFYGVFLNDDYILSVGDYNEISDDAVSAYPLIQFLTRKAEEVIQMVREGAYNQMIEKELPFCYRKGMILRKDYYDLFPDKQQELLGGLTLKELTEDEIREFTKYAERTEIADEDLIPDMTARTFFEACACGYKGCGYMEKEYTRFQDTEEEHNRYGKITPRELYSMYADGRDDGLCALPLDDEEAFKEWDQEKGPYYKFNGHHPFEVRTSFSISHSIHLYPRKKKDFPDPAKQAPEDRGGFSPNGWYFMVSCSEPAQTEEVARWTLALARAHYPVLVRDGKEIAKRLTGDGRVGVMPQGSRIYSGHNYGTFASDIFDTVVLEDEDYENPDVTGKIEWIPEARLELRI